MTTGYADTHDRTRRPNTRAATTPDEYPIFQAHLALAAQCREVEADAPESERC